MEDTMVLGINDAGQIVGKYTDTRDNKVYGFVGSPTPIPGAVWLLGSGFVGLLGFRRIFLT
jgi:hypothetical protein